MAEPALPELCTVTTDSSTLSATLTTAACNCSALRFEETDEPEDAPDVETATGPCDAEALFCEASVRPRPARKAPTINTSASSPAEIARAGPWSCIAGAAARKGGS